MSAALLRQQLRALLNDIEQQITAVGNLAHTMGCTPSEIRDMQGGYILIPLYTAKSNVLLALSNLEKS